MIHIGTLLHQYLEKNRIRRAALAKLMNINLANLMKMEKKESIQTARLIELSTHLKHNFFMDIALMLPKEYTSTNNIFEVKDQQIETLKKEIEKLTIERDVLLKITQS